MQWCSQGRIFGGGGKKGWSGGRRGQRERGQDVGAKKGVEPGG